MVIVDTTVWVDYLAGVNNKHTEWLERNIGLARIAMTDLILSEILQGLRSQKEFHAVKSQLLEFPILWGGGLELAVTAAANFRQLRERGFTIRKTIDCWIATFCLLQGHVLLHRNRDFDVFEKELGLIVVKP
jgi:predicted nucleic acid-binding protein